MLHAAYMVVTCCYLVGTFCYLVLHVVTASYKLLLVTVVCRASIKPLSMHCFDVVQVHSSVPFQHVLSLCNGMQHHVSPYNRM